MKISHVMFSREVPSPRAVSRSRSNWVLSFDGPDFTIERSGDTVAICSRETGRTILYPWCTVAAAEPERPSYEITTQPAPAPAPLPAPAPTKNRRQL